MNRKSFDLTEMSLQTGISIVDLKDALGIELDSKCKAKTVSEASEAFQSTESGSEEERAAYKRWNELSIALIEKANTMKLIAVAYESSPPESEAASLALIKWIKVGKEAIRMAIALEDLEDILGDLPQDRNLENLTIRKIAKFYGWRDKK